ncbi:MAG TPA: aldehyde dehydrogenase family protein [Candidatus Baltobacteraceae bacterium]|jgi:aldehyde dehydrogenase (NAD(P)+)|nr:aldehyde dehydrogenase family protein [Candidatus Baltobacteraceae bacterium]
MRTVESVDAIDRDLERLSMAKDAWARTSVARKISLLQALRRNVHSIAPDWVSAAANAKGLRENSPLAGEEWISGPWAVLYAINRYLRTLNAIDNTGEPRLPPMRVRAGGQVALDVFPYSVYDRVLLNGVRAEVRMQQGVDIQQTRRSAAAFYREAQPDGHLAVVLGAGNISSIAPLDVLYKLLAEGAVCMLKMNPVNDYLGPIFERAFEPFVDAGFLRFAYGGAETGAYLCAHPAVDRIHVTGSERTHNAIVAQAGSGKQITSELGNVSPTIVVPGAWSAADVRFQAENIATQKAHNAGFNCIAAQVLILPRDWEHSGALRDEVARVFERMEPRPEYYPGAAARRIDAAGPESGLRCVIDIDRNADAAFFQNETFSGVLATVELPGDTEAFVRAAVAFANERLHGTLGANVIAHPRTMRESSALVEQAVDDLRYGCIGVNAWTGVGYFITETPWGAYPGHTIDDIQSGIGVVHNSYFLERTEKSVVRAPFTPFPRSARSGERTLLPRPPWFITNTRQAEVGRALCDFENAPNPLAAARVAALALRA